MGGGWGVKPTFPRPLAQKYLINFIYNEEHKHNTHPHPILHVLQFQVTLGPDLVAPDIALECICPVPEPRGTGDALAAGGQTSRAGAGGNTPSIHGLRASVGSLGVSELGDQHVGTGEGGSSGRLSSETGVKLLGAGVGVCGGLRLGPSLGSRVTGWDLVTVIVLGGGGAGEEAGPDP